MSNQKHNLNETINDIHATLAKKISSGEIDDFDNMTVKDLRLRLFEQNPAGLVNNDDKASIASVIVLIIFGRDKGQQEGIK